MILENVTFLQISTYVLAFRTSEKCQNSSSFLDQNVTPYLHLAIQTYAHFELDMPVLPMIDQSLAND